METTVAAGRTQSGTYRWRRSAQNNYDVVLVTVISESWCHRKCFAVFSQQVDDVLLSL